MTNVLYCMSTFFTVLKIEPIVLCMLRKYSYIPIHWFSVTDHYVVWVGLELVILPASHSRVLGLQAFNTRPGLICFISPMESVHLWERWMGFKKYQMP